MSTVSCLVVEPSPDGTRWVACRPGFFLPVRVLSRLFRRLFLQELQAAFTAGQLGFFGDLAHLADPAAFTHRLDRLRRTDWVVFGKPPFGGPNKVLAYLGPIRIASPELFLEGLSAESQSQGDDA